MANILEESVILEEDTLKGKFMTFLLGKECYGIEICYVTEIIGIQAITELPELPKYVKGIINLRGKIILVMDVRIRFGRELKEYNDRTCIIVVDIADISIGLIVDTVAEVLPIDDNNIVPPPQINKEVHNKYIKAIGKSGNDVILILDCEKLLNYKEIESLCEVF